jgi:hypothetical protein
MCPCSSLGRALLGVSGCRWVLTEWRTEGRRRILVTGIL